jgi:hypothetical protein
MAKTSVQQLITDILKRMSRDPAGTLERADVLRRINISNQEILTQESLRFMMTAGTLAVVSSTCAVPSTVDPSKTMTLQRVSGDGEIVYVEIDRWYMDGVDTWGSVTQTEPSTYTVAGSNFLFHPTGLTVSVPYIAQLRVTALTDAADSFSQLPEGWENTLLAVDAESELRREMDEPQWGELKARANSMRQQLYGSERSSKIQAKTDREQKERKIEKAQLSDEAAP